MRQELLVERAPIRTDPDGLAVADRGFDDRAELAVLLLLEADIARVDAIFRQRLRAGGMAGEQLVAYVVEVAAERTRAPEPAWPLAPPRHALPPLRPIDGDSHD